MQKKSEWYQNFLKQHEDTGFIEKALKRIYVESYIMYQSTQLIQTPEVIRQIQTELEQHGCTTSDKEMRKAVKDTTTIIREEMERNYKICDS